MNTIPTDDFVFLIRAYNEEKIIGKTLDEILDAGYRKIIIVDDGSTDKTHEEVQKRIETYADNDVNIILLSHSINRGGGAANKTGIQFLKRHHKEIDATWVMTFDADVLGYILNSVHP